MIVTTLGRLRRDQEARREAMETYAQLVLQDVPEVFISADVERTLRDDTEGYILTALIYGAYYGFSFLRSDGVGPGQKEAALGVIGSYPPGTISLIPAGGSSVARDIGAVEMLC